MLSMDSLPFWRMFLAGCGFETVLSDPTNKKIIQAGLDSVVAEPCFPIIVAHGHVANLADKGTDYIFLPCIVSIETQWMHTESHLCPWHQTLPFVCRRAPALQQCAEKFVVPTIHFREGKGRVVKELQEYFARGPLRRRLGVTARKVAWAAEAAFKVQDRFRARVLEAGRGTLERLDQAGAIGIVLIGRPYNVHDAAVNLSVAAKLRSYYGVNCIPQDFLETEIEDIRDVHPGMYWNLGQRILAAAKIVARRANLHIIYITNFKCGPDSFIKHFVRPASGKPFLTLQFDGHSNDAGMMTRCEAYLDSKGILRPWRSEIQAQAPAPAKAGI
ncbi:MAG: hypothetical protein KAX19_00895, partial [Candidatus Brocadiae bacterium]|nr:hypothetical protein [Candidatus Brocadiia bacterium]